MERNRVLSITLFDLDSKVGAMAHIDAGTKVHDSLDIILKEMELTGSSVKKVEARLFGGVQGESEKIVYNLKDRLTEAGIKIVEQDILHFSDSSADIQFDTRTGKATDYDVIYKMDEALLKEKLSWFDKLLTERTILFIHEESLNPLNRKNILPSSMNQHSQLKSMDELMIEKAFPSLNEIIMKK